jgi:hypothetical protein
VPLLAEVLDAGCRHSSVISAFPEGGQQRERRIIASVRRSRTALWAAIVLVVAGVGVGLQMARNHRPVAPEVNPVKQSEAERLREYLFAQLQPVALKNCDLRRFGEPNDGGYLMCANLLRAAESGYSYGISGYDGWGCQISAHAKIPVHQYDCFDPRRPACPAGRTIFHRECVGPETGMIDGRPFDTIERQIAANGDVGKHLVMKMDVEGAEWDSFRRTADAVFERIDQLAVEFHGVLEERFMVAIMRLKDFFFVANLHFNNFTCKSGIEPFPADTYEVLFVNKHLGVVDDRRSAIRPHPLDAPNSPTQQDCQR